jgi:hypothetical protein
VGLGLGGGSIPSRPVIFGVYMLKIKKCFKRLLQGTYMFPAIIKNPHGGIRFVRKGRVKGKKIISKFYSSKETGERSRRQDVIQNLRLLQGKNYILNVSKRYPSNKLTKTEAYYDLPNLYDVFRVHGGIMTGRLRKFCAKNKISPDKLLEMCNKAYIELENKQREANVQFDNGPGNLVVDIDKKGKLIFTIFDF